MLTQVIKLVSDATGFQKGVAQTAGMTKAAFGNISNEISGRFAAMFTASAIVDRIVGFTHAVIDNADALDEMSDIMNMSIEDIQRLQAAANLAGIPFKKVKGVLDGIANMQQQAMTGDKTKMNLFENLGINPQNASALEIMIAAVEASGKGFKEQAAAADILGKRMNDISATVRSFKNLGPISLITEEQGKIIAKAKDDLEMAWNRTKVAATPAVTTGLKLTTSFLDALNNEGKQTAIASLLGLGPAALGRLFGEAGRNFIGLGSPVAGESKSTSNAQSAASFSPPPSISLSPQSDALARIGLFVGGAGQSNGEAMVTIGNYQLSELRKIRSVLEEAHR